MEQNRIPLTPDSLYFFLTDGHINIGYHRKKELTEFSNRFEYGLRELGWYLSWLLHRKLPPMHTDLVYWGVIFSEKNISRFDRPDERLARQSISTQMLLLEVSPNLVNLDILRFLKAASTDMKQAEKMLISIRPRLRLEYIGTPFMDEFVSPELVRALITGTTKGI